MKKKFILCAVYLTISVVYIDAQTKNDYPPPPPPPPVEDLIVPPLPPAPPVPPLPPPVPPPPPPGIEQVAFVSQVIVNSNGYEMAIQHIKGAAMVIIQKKGVTQKIRLATWNADRKYHEKKYGMLPPPPPPVPEENTDIEKDIQ